MVRKKNPLGITLEGRKTKKLNEFFSLTWKKIAIAILIFVLSVILHNFIYGVGEAYNINLAIGEIFFFIVAVFVIPIYLTLAFFYALFVLIKNNEIRKIKKQSIIAIIFGIIIGYGVAYFSGFFNTGFFIFGIFFSIFFAVIIYYFIEIIKRIKIINKLKGGKIW